MREPLQPFHVLSLVLIQIFKTQLTSVAAQTGLFLTNLVTKRQIFLYCRQGKVEESIEYLKQFVEVAEKSGQEQAYSKACHNLGNIYNSLVSKIVML